MDPVSAGIIAGGSVLGGLGSGLFSSRSQDKNLKFQKYMARHAHQLQVQDMRKAGLNPILSGLGGSGATASGGSGIASIPNLGESAMTALQAKRLSAETDLIEQQQNTAWSLARQYETQANVNASQAWINSLNKDILEPIAKTSKGKPGEWAAWADRAAPWVNSAGNLLQLFKPGGSRNFPGAFQPAPMNPRNRGY